MKRFILIDPEYLENDEEKQKYTLQETVIDKLKSIINNDSLSSIEMLKLLKLTIGERNYNINNVTSDQPESYQFPPLNENNNKDNNESDKNQFELLETQNIIPYNGDDDDGNNQLEEDSQSEIVTKFPINKNNYNIKNNSVEEIINNNQLYKRLLKKSNIKWNKKTGYNVEFSGKKFPNLSIYQLIRDIENENAPIYEELKLFYLFLSKNYLKEFCLNENILNRLKKWKRL